MSMMSARWSRLYGGTPAELAAEDAIARLAIPYRTNFPGFLYGVRSFPDVFFPTIGVVLEVDDASHRLASKVEADAERTASLKAAWGVDVVRITNEQALTDPDGAIRSALASVGKWPLPAHRPTVAQSLPRRKSAPQKQRREAKSAALKASRARPRSARA